MVDVFLDAGTAMAWGQSAAGSTSKQARFNTLRLSVIGHILNNDTPFTFNVQSSFRPGINDIARADVSSASDPVALVEGFAVVVGIIEFIFFRRTDAINQVIS